MMRFAGILGLFVLMVVSPANGAIVWESEYYQFRFAVQPNGGVFYDPVAQYFNPDGQAIEVITNVGATTGPFSDMASGSLMEFGGAIQMNAMAKGPDGGINPENGVLVQGYAQINLNEFGDNYGVDVDQLAKSWITRRFSVDESGDYYLSAHLTGDADFAAFGDPVLRHHALYSYSGTVFLEEYQENPYTWLREVARLTFDNTTGNDMTTVELSDEPNILYQLKVVLDIATDVKNLYMMTSITGALEGPFQVGSADEPYKLAAFVSSESPTQSCSLCSTLGNDPKAYALDQDIFKFNGTEGETVTVRLEADPPEAGLGKRATLVLRNMTDGLQLFRRLDTGLPHEITVTLPVSAEYHVLVGEKLNEAALWGERAYAGDYCITLEASPDTCQTFEATDSVE